METAFLNECFKILSEFNHKNSDIKIIDILRNTFLVYLHFVTCFYYKLYYVKGSSQNFEGPEKQTWSQLTL